jgi:hypothetical protein
VTTPGMLCQFRRAHDDDDQPARPAPCL